MKVKITEGQYKKLTEAALPGFRLDVLRSKGDFKGMLKYCIDMFGEPIGAGSSRIVFQIDDETVLKLAGNDKGIAQNKEEMKIGLDSELTYVPKVFNGSDEKDGLWIISEYVLPAEKKDFRKVFGIKFDDISNFCFFLQSTKGPFSKHYANLVREIYDDYSWCVNGTKLLREIELLFNKHDSMVNDLVQLANWGMCRRNGKTYMVMLDAGCSQEVFNRYYRFKF